MKKNLLIILLILTIIVFGLYSVFYFKVEETSVSTRSIYNTGPEVCSTCQCQFDNLFKNWTAENIANYKEVYPIDYKLVDTLTESNIKSYFTKIMDTNGTYIPRYSINSKTLSLITFAENRKEMQERGYTIGKMDSLSSALNLTLKRHLELGLKPGNKVYLIKVKNKDQIIDNYAFCDAKINNVIFDNLFLFFGIPIPDNDASNKSDQ